MAERLRDDDSSWGRTRYDYHLDVASPRRARKLAAEMRERAVREQEQLEAARQRDDMNDEQEGTAIRAHNGVSLPATGRSKTT